MATVGDLKVKLGVDNAGFNKGISGAQKVMQGLASVVKVGAAAAGTAIIGLGKSALTSGGDFEAGMSQVAATMGTTTDKITNLSAIAKEMGATTKFSASQSAEALNYLALAGYDAEKQISALPVVLDLAAAGGMDLAYASDLVTDSMSALGITTDKLGSFTDQLAKTAQKSNTSVAQLGEAILTVGGSAKTLQGGTIELNTALGLLADNGIKGAEGGTKLRNMIISLSAPTAAAKEQLELLGVSAVDADGELRPLNQIFGELNTALDGMGGADKAAILNNIFNKQDMAAVNALMGTTVERFSELSLEISNAEGAASAMAKTMEDNLKGSLTRFKSAFEGFSIAIFEGDEAGMDAAIQGMLSEAGNMISKYLKPMIKSLAKAVPMLISALSEALLPMVPELISTLSTSMAESLPLVVQTFVDMIPQLVAVIGEQLPLLMQAGMDIILILLEGMAGNSQLIVSTVIKLIESFINIIAQNLPLILQAGYDIMLGIIKGLLTALPSLLKTVIEMIPVILETFVSFLPEFINLGISLLTALISELPYIISVIVEALPQIISSIVKALMTQVPLLISAGVQLFLALIANLPEIIGEIVKAVPAIIKGLIEGFSSMLGTMGEIGFNLIKGVWEGIKNAASWLKEKISGFLSNIFGGETIDVGLNAVSDSTVSAAASFANTAANMSSTYNNTYNNVYQAATPNNEAINMTDFYNRQRNAYA